jgi:3-oxoacyl-[acyl-carrier protein] reductase
VTAGSRGIGRGCAEALADQGFSLAVCARDQELLDEVVGHLGALGAQALAVVADLRRREAIEEVFERVDEAYGRLDVLVANAGGPARGDFGTVMEEDWEDAYHLTLMSVVRSIRLAVPRMDRGFGRIVVVGSSSVRRPIPDLVLSNVFRPALAGLVKTVAAELGPDGITVNLVAPGRIDTGHARCSDERRAHLRGTSYDEVRREFERAIPIGRYGSPREFGACVAFLASAEAAYITGQTILVDGGLVSALP